MAINEQDIANIVRKRFKGNGGQKTPAAKKTAAAPKLKRHF